ncbi:hypothetical protein GGR51DRAFT_557686 [Nemania sp. FL0031]|nr:hypothetical protein GGR51DRAFT_557686 [Nemania sp. FL0031]
MVVWSPWWLFSLVLIPVYQLTPIVNPFLTRTYPSPRQDSLAAAAKVDKRSYRRRQSDHQTRPTSSAAINEEDGGDTDIDDDYDEGEGRGRGEGGGNYHAIIPHGPPSAGAAGLVHGILLTARRIRKARDSPMHVLVDAATAQFDLDC